MARPESFDPNPDGTLDVALDCGKCVGQFPAKDVRYGTIDTSCSKPHKALRKDWK